MPLQGCLQKINFAGNLLQSRLRSDSILDEGGTRVQRKELMNPIHGVITAQHNSPPGKPRKNPGRSASPLRDSRGGRCYVRLSAQ
jgi:hypothetical protein